MTYTAYVEEHTLMCDKAGCERTCTFFGGSTAAAFTAAVQMGWKVVRYAGHPEANLDLCPAHASGETTKWRIEYKVQRNGVDVFGGMTDEADAYDEAMRDVIDSMGEWGR